MKFLPDTDPRRLVWEKCESPIEQILCCALFTWLGCKAITGDFNNSRLLEMATVANNQPCCFLFAQHVIGRYRADFIVVAVNPAKRIANTLVIEFDGKRFHSDAEQLAYDARRDDEIRAAGFGVMRVSGALIHADVRVAIGRIEAWAAERIGYAKPPRGDGDVYDVWLGLTSPDPIIAVQRQHERDAYWQNAEDEQADEGALRQRQAECP